MVMKAEDLYTEIGHLTAENEKLTDMVADLRFEYAKLLVYAADQKRQIAELEEDKDTLKDVIRQMWEAKPFTADDIADARELSALINKAIDFVADERKHLSRFDKS